MKTTLRTVLLSLVVATFATVSDAQVSLLVSQSTGNLDLGYGFPRWSEFTDRLNNAVAAAPGSVTTVSDVTNAGLLASSTALLLDQRWIGGSLSPAEMTNLTDYISSGRHILMIGENINWSSWDNQLLSLVGDVYSGDSSGNAIPLGANPLTAGVGTLPLASAGFSAGLTGTDLFNINFSRLYGTNVLTILDVNLFENSRIGGASNSQYADNVISWLVTPTAAPAEAVPEPSSYGLLGAIALLGLIAFRRIRCN